MKKTILLIFIFLGFSSICVSQTGKNAVSLDIKGTVIFYFIADDSACNFVCPLIPEVIIDSVNYHFIPHCDANYSIIKEDSILQSIIGKPELYLKNNFESIVCAYNKHRFADKINCDSVIKQYTLHNIYDSCLYKPDHEEHMVEKIISNSIYKKQDSDTIIIAIYFTGSVIKYENIVYGEQSDYRLYEDDEGIEEFDDSHGSCTFEKLNSTFIVLNKVERLAPISLDIANKLKIEKVDIDEIKIFMHM